jgi:hypothetical protein
LEFKEPKKITMKDKFPPPWIKHPDIKRFSIGWRMGMGESYLRDWYNFFDNLNRKEQRNYQNENPEAISWWGFYNLHSSIILERTFGIVKTLSIFLLCLLHSIFIFPFIFIKERINRY